jgi:ribosome-associated protein
MPDSIDVAIGIRVPADAIVVRAVRASGPGGQNVNKVASKVELHVDLGRVQGLDEAARARLRALSAGRLDSDGRLLVTSQRTRDQGRNLEDARRKVAALVERSLLPPKPRRSTHPGAAARQRRLAEKRRLSEKKRQRRGADED